MEIREKEKNLGDKPLVFLIGAVTGVVSYIALNSIWSSFQKKYSQIPRSLFLIEDDDKSQVLGVKKGTKLPFEKSVEVENKHNFAKSIILDLLASNTEVIDLEEAEKVGKVLVAIPSKSSGKLSLLIHLKVSVHLQVKVKYTLIPKQDQLEGKEEEEEGDVKSQQVEKLFLPNSLTFQLSD